MNNPYLFVYYKIRAYYRAIIYLRVSILISTIIGLVIIFFKLFFSSYFVKRTSGPHILFFNHYFSQDINALKKANSYFRITVISALSIGRMFRLFVKNSTDEWYSFYDKSNIKGRKNYIDFCNKYLISMFNIFNIKVFITPSDIFPYLRDLIPLLRKNNTLTVVIDKEGTIAPYDFEYFASKIKEYYPFISDIILVWSPRQKEFWKKCGIENDSQIYITGQPRSDFWFDKNYRPSRKVLKYIKQSKINVLLLSFEKSAYIPEELYKSEQITWDSLYNDVHESVVYLAQKYPGINFIVKTHPQQNLDDITKEKLSSVKNISIVSGAKLSNELVLNSNIIIGFQTTVLIESMICSKPIIYTYWGDAPKIETYLLPFHKTNALFVAHSKNELLNYFEKLLVNPDVPAYQKKEREKFINEYFYNCDGHSAERALNVISEKIKHL